MKKFKSIILAFVAVMFLFSCRGPMGQQGPIGPQGPSGQDGNSNVISSTVTVYPNDWYWDNNTSWRVDIDYDAISSHVNNEGAVLVYMDNQNTWRQLPLTFYYSENINGQEQFFSSSLEVSSYTGGVSIFWTENDMVNNYRPEQHDFKIVVIDGALYKSRTDIDYSDYDAVKAAFQLTD